MIKRNPFQLSVGFDDLIIQFLFGSQNGIHNCFFVKKKILHLCNNHHITVLFLSDNPFFKHIKRSYVKRPIIHINY